MWYVLLSDFMFNPGKDSFWELVSEHAKKRNNTSKQFVLLITEIIGELVVNVTKYVSIYSLIEEFT